MQQQQWTSERAARRRAEELRQDARVVEARAMRLAQASHLWRRVDELRAEADRLESQATGSR